MKSINTTSSTSIELLSSIKVAASWKNINYRFVFHRKSHRLIHSLLSSPCEHSKINNRDKMRIFNSIPNALFDFIIIVKSASIKGVGRAARLIASINCIGIVQLFNCEKSALCRRLLSPLRGCRNDLIDKEAKQIEIYMRVEFIK